MSSDSSLLRWVAIKINAEINIFMSCAGNGNSVRWFVCGLVTYENMFTSRSHHDHHPSCPNTQVMKQKTLGRFGHNSSGTFRIQRPSMRYRTDGERNESRDSNRYKTKHTHGAAQSKTHTHRHYRHLLTMLLRMVKILISIR